MNFKITKDKTVFYCQLRSDMTEEQKEKLLKKFFACVVNQGVDEDLTIWVKSNR
jgi:hypothetical protein